MPNLITKYENGKVVVECKLCKCFILEKDFIVELRTCKKCMEPWEKESADDFKELKKELIYKGVIK